MEFPAPSSVIVRSPSSSTNVNARRWGSSLVRGVHAAAERERPARPAAELVVPDRGEEVDLSSQPHELARRVRPAAPGLLPRVAGARGSLPAAAYARPRRSAPTRHVRRLPPSQIRPPRALEKMMALVLLPPFESFYAENRDAVLRELRRLSAAGRGGRLPGDLPARAARVQPAPERRQPARLGADDRAPRRRRPLPPARGGARGSRSRSATRAPAYAELGDLADELPQKERAAVVLRYGYDLSYAAIGAALGSSEDAARQAASSGVRRLRRRMQ